MGKMKKNNSNTRQAFSNTRKALRKQKRQQKKVHRQEHYLKKKIVQDAPKYTPGQFVKRPADTPESDTKPKKRKKTNSHPMLQDIISKERQKELKEAAQLKSQMEDQRRKQFLQANEDEDKVIKKLEKQLGLNKCKNKKNYFADDGLDYLLEICDRTTSEQIVAAEKHLAEVEGESDFEEDLAAVTGREVPGKKDKEKEKKDSKKIESDNESDEEMDENSGEDGNSDDSDESNNENSGDFDDGSEEGDAFDGIMSGSDGDDKMPDSEAEEKTASKRSPLKAKDTKPEKSKSSPDKSKSKERIISADDLSKVFSDDEVSNLSGDDDDMEGFSGEDNDVEEKSNEKPDVWEDIYGRKRDKEGNVIKEEKGVYIPPHLRNKDSGSDKELAQLKRQIKSILNKLAGTNLHWACTSIESLYASNSRNSVNSALTRLWLDATVGPANTPDRMVAEHAALVSALHANVGSEIGAHFLQELTKMFDGMMQTTQPMEDKTLDNLVSCLAHLYSFKIYHASLLYDIFSRLLEKLTEKNIDCVLVALRSVGGVLRKEEPVALKNFIHDTQGRIAGMSEKAADGSRIKFLLEVLLAVKNNNLNKIPNYEPTYAEGLKKATRQIVRKGNYVTPLNIRLEDLLKADERGKWWVVGSAWEGSRALPDDQGTKPPTAGYDQKFLNLAREQRMNTDVRRSIFCVIMSAEDFMDAFEKLQHLGLRGQQEREIVHVLLACCLQEKTYNPYYAVLAQKLCDTDRKYQLSIQYSTWDKIKELENLPKHSTTNLAQFLVHLIMEKGLALSVLKVIQFSDLNKHTVRFMRQILLSIIMNGDVEASTDVFRRVARPPALKMFRESVRLFIKHFLTKQDKSERSKVLSEGEGEMLKERVADVDRILTMHENKMKL